MTAVAATAPLKATEALGRSVGRPETAPASPAQAHEADRRRGLVIGNLGLLTEIDIEGEVLDDARLYPLPRTQPWCRGLVNLRGKLVPAFDLHEYLGLTAFAAQRRWWLVLRTSMHELAVAVDALPPALTVTPEARVDANPPLPEKLRDHVGAAYRVDDGLWFDFRHGDFFARLAAEVAR